MVRSPVVGIMSNYLLNFNMPSQGYMEELPQLAGKTWAEAMFYLPDAIAFGLVQGSRRVPWPAPLLLQSNPAQLECSTASCDTNFVWRRRLSQLQSCPVGIDVTC